MSQSGRNWKGTHQPTTCKRPPPCLPPPIPYHVCRKPPWGTCQSLSGLSGLLHHLLRRPSAVLGGLEGTQRRCLRSKGRESKPSPCSSCWLETSKVARVLRHLNLPGIKVPETDSLRVSESCRLKKNQPGRKLLSDHGNYSKVGLKV